MALLILTSGIFFYILDQIWLELITIVILGERIFCLSISIQNQQKELY